MKSSPFLQRPWIYYGLFLLTNLLLSYSPISWSWKCFIGLLGLVIPLYLALRNAPNPQKKENPGYLEKGTLSIPFWLLLSGIILMVFLRFYKLTSLFCFPTGDEGWYGTTAIELSHHWNWKFFYATGQAPPLPIWTMALLLKMGFSPALSLWLPSAVLSLLSVFLAYQASRWFFSPAFSMILSGLMGFSYWPLFTARSTQQGDWLVPWVCLCLFLWGGFKKCGQTRHQGFWAAGLGLGLALGSFTFTPWLLIAAFFSLSFFWDMVIQTKKNRIFFPVFLFFFLLGLIPFLYAVEREGYGQHISSISLFSGQVSFQNVAANCLSYFTVLFWGCLIPEGAYIPTQGGFLNPFLTSFFFLGLIEAYRFRLVPLVQWAGAAFILFLIPGLLSSGMESFRIVQVIPILLFFTAWGIYFLMREFENSRQLIFFSLLMLFIAAWDFNGLTRPYRDLDTRPEKFGKSMETLERYRAYQILEDYETQQGPGYVLTSFNNQSFTNASFSVMTYPFNAARNPVLASQASSYPENFHWLAVFVNVSYEPFLKKRFPEGKWFWVSKDLPLLNGGDMLGIIPLTPENHKILERWNAAHAFFEEADLRYYFQNFGPYKDSIKSLEKAYPLVQGDPFLESCFWDKRASYEYENVNLPEHLRSYQMAIQFGYPTAELYWNYGLLLLTVKRYPEGRQALIKATQAPLDLTPAKSLLNPPDSPR